MTLYNCKAEIDREGATVYRITKFTSDLDVEASYLTTRESCECPAGVRDTCRHRQMLPKFLARRAVNTFWMYDFDRDGWVSYDLGAEIDAPEGITIIDLSKASPEEVFNTIADAVGEPCIEHHPQPKPRRRGF